LTADEQANDLGVEADKYFVRGKGLSLEHFHRGEIGVGDVGVADRV